MISVVIVIGEGQQLSLVLLAVTVAERHGSGFDNLIARVQSTIQIIPIDKILITGRQFLHRLKVVEIAADDRPEKPAARPFCEPELTAFDESVAPIPDLRPASGRSATGFEIARPEIIAVDRHKVLGQFHAGLRDFPAESQPDAVQREILPWLSMEEIDFGSVGEGAVEGGGG